MKENCGFNNENTNQHENAQNFFQMNENEEFLLQQMIQNTDVGPMEQPVLDFQSFPSFPENNQSMYSQRTTPNDCSYTLNTPVYEGEDIKCETDTRSPLEYNEDRVNLSEIKSEDNLNCLAANPLFVLSIIPWPGPVDFKVVIPSPNLQGVKPKWCFSKTLSKLYVAKNVAFPINMTLNSYPVGASLNFCPVYTKSSNRMVPVNRCPNCFLADSNTESNNHVIQVEGLSAYYFCQNNRYMVSVPLGQPAPGDNSLNVFLKVCCNTSCPGGPNRKPFSILITLKLGEHEIGRQVIDVKCCEGPLRDMSTDEKRAIEHGGIIEFNSLNVVRQVAKDVANIKCEKPSKKRKMSDRKPVDTSDATSGYESVMVPTRYVNRVKKFMNQLYFHEQIRKHKDPKYKKLFPTVTSESD